MGSVDAFSWSLAAAPVVLLGRRFTRKHAVELDARWFLLKLQEEVGELTQVFLMKTGQARDKEKTSAELEADFRSELTDVLCQVLLLARHHSIDLETAVADKWLVWNPIDPVRRPHLGATSTPPRTCLSIATDHANRGRELGQLRRLRFAVLRRRGPHGRDQRRRRHPGAPQDRGSRVGSLRLAHVVINSAESQSTCAFYERHLDFWLQMP